MSADLTAPSINLVSGISDKVYRSQPTNHRPSVPWYPAHTVTSGKNVLNNSAVVIFSPIFIFSLSPFSLRSLWNSVSHQATLELSESPGHSGTEQITRPLGGKLVVRSSCHSAEQTRLLRPPLRDFHKKNTKIPTRESQRFYFQLGRNYGNFRG